MAPACMRIGRKCRQTHPQDGFRHAAAAATPPLAPRRRLDLLFKLFMSHHSMNAVRCSCFQMTLFSLRIVTRKEGLDLLLQLFLSHHSLTGVACLKYKLLGGSSDGAQLGFRAGTCIPSLSLHGTLTRFLSGYGIYTPSLFHHGACPTSLYLWHASRISLWSICCPHHTPRFVAHVSVITILLLYILLSLHLEL